MTVKPISLSNTTIYCNNYMINSEKKGKGRSTKTEPAKTLPQPVKNEEIKNKPKKDYSCIRLYDMTIDEAVKIYNEMTEITPGAAELLLPMPLKRCAIILSKLEGKKVAEILSTLPECKKSEIFLELYKHSKEKALAAFHYIKDPNKKTDLLSGLPLEVAVDILRPYSVDDLAHIAKFMQPYLAANIMVGLNLTDEQIRNVMTIIDQKMDIKNNDLEVAGHNFEHCRDQVSVSENIKRKLKVAYEAKRLSSDVAELIDTIKKSSPKEAYDILLALDSKIALKVVNNLPKDKLSHIHAQALVERIVSTIESNGPQSFSGFIDNPHYDEKTVSLAINSAKEQGIISQEEAQELQGILAASRKIIKWRQLKQKEVIAQFNVMDVPSQGKIIQALVAKDLLDEAKLLLSSIKPEIVLKVALYINSCPRLKGKQWDIIPLDKFYDLLSDENKRAVLLHIPEIISEEINKACLVKFLSRDINKDEPKLCNDDAYLKSAVILYPLSKENREKILSSFRRVEQISKVKEYLVLIDELQSWKNKPVEQLKNDISKIDDVKGAILIQEILPPAVVAELLVAELLKDNSKVLEWFSLLEPGKAAGILKQLPNKDIVAILGKIKIAKSMASIIDSINDIDIAMQIFSSKDISLKIKIETYIKFEDQIACLGFIVLTKIKSRLIVKLSKSDPELAKVLIHALMSQKQDLKSAEIMTGKDPNELKEEALANKFSMFLFDPSLNYDECTSFVKLLPKNIVINMIKNGMLPNEFTRKIDIEWINIPSKGPKLIAQLINNLNDEKARKIVKSLSKEKALEVLKLCNPNIIIDILNHLDKKEKEWILAHSNYIKHFYCRKDELRPKINVDYIIGFGVDPNDKGIIKMKEVLKLLPPEHFAQIEEICIFSDYGDERNESSWASGSVLGMYQPGNKSLDIYFDLNNNSRVVSKGVRINGIMPINESVIHEVGHSVEGLLLKKDWMGFVGYCWEYEGEFTDNAFDKFFFKITKGSEAFISDYAMTNPHEDFAECYVNYVLNGAKFREKAEQNPVLKKKYEFMKYVVFKGREY